MDNFVTCNEEKVKEIWSELYGRISCVPHSQEAGGSISGTFYLLSKSALCTSSHLGDDG